MFNSKADTEKKLETIEGLLKDLKKATQKGTQGDLKCTILDRLYEVVHF